MKLTFQPMDLQLLHPFTISRSTKKIVPSMLVMLEQDGIVGYGEASPSERYGESQGTVAGFLQRIDLMLFQDPFQIEKILNSVDQIAVGNGSAKAAIDIALHDWIGKRLGIPVWKLFGLSKDNAPQSSFTIGIDSPGVIEQKLQEAELYQILKVKVGVPDDREIIQTIRQQTGKILRVDANEGWKSKEEALDKILWLEEQGVELVEQPMPANALEQIAWLRERVHIPLIADESVLRLTDIPTLSNAFDGINIKLMKCSGIHEALKMIHTAKAFNMKIMLGCMIESSIGISAAAQLSPLVDYADLDGNLLITNDPFYGVTLAEEKLVLSDNPGIGIHPRAHE